MKVQLLKECISISPENVLEEVYLDTVLGFHRFGCVVTRERGEKEGSWGSVVLEAEKNPGPLPPEQLKP